MLLNSYKFFLHIIIILLLLFSTVKLIAQPICSDTLGVLPKIKHKLEIADKSSTSKDSIILLCHQIEKLSLTCPPLFADYLITAYALLSNKAKNTHQLGQFLQLGEKALEKYSTNLSDSLILRSKFMLAFQRCRLDDIQGNLHSSIHCYEQIWRQLPDTHPDTTLLDRFKKALPISIAYSLIEIGDYKASIDWLEMIANRITEEDIIYFGDLHHLIGQAKKQLGLYLSLVHI